MMATQELRERLGDRRLSDAEVEAQLVEGLRPVVQMAMAAAMAHKPLDRGLLQRQCIGLLRVMGDPRGASVNQSCDRTIMHETHPATGIPAEVKDANPIS